MDLNKYWRDVIEIADSLPQRKIFYLTSIENPEKGTVAGQTFDVSDRREVARRIVEKTHRMATGEETDNFLARTKRQTEELAEQELARKQQFAMPQELQTLVRMAVQGVAAEAAKSAPAADEGKPPKKEK